jgi:hypothetical protein
MNIMLNPILDQLESLTWICPGNRSWAILLNRIATLQIEPMFTPSIVVNIKFFLSMDLFSSDTLASPTILKWQLCPL